MLGQQGEKCQMNKIDPDWRLWVMILSESLLAIANDDRLNCRCGEDYTDGEQCPKCWASAQGQAGIDVLNKYKSEVKSVK